MNPDPDRLAGEIAAALEEHDIKLASALLRVLAISHPYRAQEVYDAIETAIALRKAATA